MSSSFPNYIHSTQQHLIIMQTLHYTAAAAATITNFRLCLNGLFFPEIAPG